MIYTVKIGFYYFEFVSFEEAGNFAVAAKQHITKDDKDVEIMITVGVDTTPDVAN